MKSQASFSHRRPMIEPLEQRIAPALLVTGANLLGAGNPTTGQISVGGNSLTVVKVLSGDAIVWFQGNSITAISVGPNTSLDITGDVGSIIGNLTATGKLSDSDGNPANGLDGDMLLANNITGITTHPLGGELGSIGNIITGGSVSNVNVSGNLEGIFAGNGAFYTGNTNALLDSHVLSGSVVGVYTGSAVDVNPVLPGTQSGFTFGAGIAQFQSGASITNVKVGGAEEMQLFAGDGFAGTPASQGHPATAGLAGGSISNVTIDKAFVDTNLSSKTPAYDLMAGSGGSGVKGGAGGSIQNVTEITSNGVVDLFAGQGGHGSNGAGGAGGSISNLNMQSNSSAYTILAGSGGYGSPGGAGGNVKGVNFGGNVLSNGIIVAAPFTQGSSDDVLLVDSLSGNMVLEKNLGNGSFIPVIQDSITNLTTIAPVGTTPSGAVAVDLGTGHGLDIVVSYKGSNNLGVYINQGDGVFYLQDYSGNTYTGDTLEGTSIPLPYSPTQIAAGYFSGSFGYADVAVLMNNAGTTEAMLLSGTGNGQFTVPTVTLPLPPNPVSLVTADFGGSDILFAGFASGEIDALIPTGYPLATPFTDVNTGVMITGGIANLDFNPQEHYLLALNGTGNSIGIYSSDGGGDLTAVTSITLSGQPGTALVAHFVPETQSVNEPIEVLTSISSGSRLDVWTQQGNTFVLSSSTTSNEALKNFVPVIEGTTSGVAAVGGSLEHFAFSDAGGPFADVSLPFSGKKVDIYGGNGGDGFDPLTNVAKGGAGGEVAGMNILAGDITVQAGNGGSGLNAAAGAGGLISDTPTINVGGQTLPTILEADFVLTINAGTGGSATGTAHGATGGAGGAVTGLNLSLLQGDILVNSGDGGVGSGGAGGAGGSISSVKAVDNGGNFSITAGYGGAADGAVGSGGAGGSILNTTYTLSLTDFGMEDAYDVTFLAGYGGYSASAVGGAGGAITNINLSLETPYESVTDNNATPATDHSNTDSTLRVAVTAGYGGQGATGGAGGSIKSVVSESVFTQIVVLQGATAQQNTTFPEVNPVAAQFTAGYGGNGTSGAGGVGGSVTNLTLSGISQYDPDAADANAGQSPLVIIAGNGGSGTTTGGAGGAISNILAQNALFDTSPGAPGTAPASSGVLLNVTELTGATLISGTGGAGGTGSGGAGGAISNLNIGVSGLSQPGVLTTDGNAIFNGGALTIQTGAGGASATGKGGAGGSFTNSVVGSANAYEDYGLLLQTGAGGAGLKTGGQGGAITNIVLNSSENPIEPVDALYDTLSTVIIAGAGGAASAAAGVGGVGGSISHISETKDVNTSINLIQAGNGGASAAGVGGAGGSVSSVTTVGLIGQASDDDDNSFGAFITNLPTGGYFDTLFPGGVPEGVFSGRGGTGTTSGIAGSVSAIAAAQIAAIGAAVDPLTGLFAAASKVSNITAEYVGYNIGNTGSYQDSQGGSAAPDTVVALDGFIFSETTPTSIHATVLTGATFVA